MKQFKQLKIALVHDWLTSPGGAEQVLFSLHEIFPDAPIFTAIYDPAKFPELKNADVRTSYLNKFPFAKKYHQLFIPLMPRAVEKYDLAGFDLIISDSHACAKGAIKKAGARHICYCHTPMRYVWTPLIDPRASSSLLRRKVMKYLKKWDLKTIPRVDQFIANSEFIKARINKFYQRDAVVIYPPVDVSKFQIAENPDNYFLYVGRLVAYKKPDIVIRAFNKLNLPLKVVGSGPELKKLHKIAKPNIEFLGYVNGKSLNRLYSYCLALIFPTIEDFGIVPVEVMASGRPVIAYGKGGVTETVLEGVTGEFFDHQTPESLARALKNFNSAKYDPKKIRQRAEQFDKSIFKKNFLEYIKSKLRNN